MNNIVVRNVRSTDDYLKIASCIYLTDPFIYPAAFGIDAGQAAVAISKLMSVENGLFNPHNLAIALCENEIAGVLLYNKNGAIWNSAECAALVKDNVPDIEKFEHVSSIYFAVESITPEEKCIEVVALCVMPKFRRMEVGRHMLDWLMREYPEDTFSLDVLASNTAAIRLYKKCGFEIVAEHKGFSIDEAMRPDCYRMKKYDY